MSERLQKIRIPDYYLQFTNGNKLVETSAGNVGAAIQELCIRFARLGDEMFDGDAKLRRFVNIYVNSEDIRFLNNMETALSDGDTISIIAPVIGRDSAISAVRVAEYLRARKNASLEFESK